MFVFSSIGSRVNSVICCLGSRKVSKMIFSLARTANLYSNHVLLYFLLREDFLFKVLLDPSKKNAYLSLVRLCGAKSEMIFTTEFELTRQDYELKWLSTH